MTEVQGALAALLSLGSDGDMPGLQLMWAQVKHETPAQKKAPKKATTAPPPTASKTDRADDGEPKAKPLPPRPPSGRPSSGRPRPASGASTRPTSARTEIGRAHV